MLNIQITLENPTGKELLALIAFGTKLSEPTEETQADSASEAPEPLPTTPINLSEEPTKLEEPAAKQVEPKKRTRKAATTVESVLAELTTYAHEGTGELTEKTPFPSEVTVSDEILLENALMNGLSEDAFDSLYEKNEPAIALDDEIFEMGAAEAKTPVKLMTLFEIRDFVKARPEENKTEVLQEVLAGLNEKNLNSAIANPEKHEALCRALYLRFNV